MDYFLMIHTHCLPNTQRGFNVSRKIGESMSANKGSSYFFPQKFEMQVNRNISSLSTCPLSLVLMFLLWWTASDTPLQSLGDNREQSRL
jgi:hypothetical protein